MGSTVLVEYWCVAFLWTAQCKTTSMIDLDRAEGQQPRRIPCVSCELDHRTVFSRQLHFSLSMSITNNSLYCPYMVKTNQPLSHTHSDTPLSISAPPLRSLCCHFTAHPRLPRSPAPHPAPLSLPPPSWTMGNPPELYHKILNLPKDTSLSEIRAAYKNLVRKWKSDKHPPKPEAEARFKAITEAYEVSMFFHRRRR
jgi:hypothetical protein